MEIGGTAYALHRCLANVYYITGIFYALYVLQDVSNHVVKKDEKTHDFRVDCNPVFDSGTGDGG